MGPWLVDVTQRSELDPWLADDPPTPYRPVVMLVRGDSATVRELLPNALDAAKLDPHRVVVWVKTPEILSEEERRTLFLGDDAIIATVLSEDHKVAGWVYRRAIDVDDAVFAFERAETAPSPAGADA